MTSGKPTVGLTVARLADVVSHFLYRIHLIPPGLHRRICDRYERLLMEE